MGKFYTIGVIVEDDEGHPLINKRTGEVAQFLCESEAEFFLKGMSAAIRKKAHYRRTIVCLEEDDEHLDED